MLKREGVEKGSSKGSISSSNISASASAGIAGPSFTLRQELTEIKLKYKERTKQVDSLVAENKKLIFDFEQLQECYQQLVSFDSQQSLSLSSSAVAKSRSNSRIKADVIPPPSNLKPKSSGHNEKSKYLFRFKTLLQQSQIVQLKRQVDLNNTAQEKHELFVFNYLNENLNSIVQSLATVLNNLVPDQDETPTTKSAPLLAKKKPGPTSTSAPPKVAKPQPTTQNHLDKNLVKLIQDCIFTLESISKQTKRKEKQRLDSAADRNKVDPAFHFLSPFLDQSVKPKHASLLDIVSGSLDHLNLKHVARLEGELSDLYSTLLDFEGCLSSSWEPCVLPFLDDRIHDIFKEAMTKLMSCINGLLSVSALLPVASVPCLESVVSLGTPLISKADNLVQVLAKGIIDFLYLIIVKVLPSRERKK